MARVTLDTANLLQLVGPYPASLPIGAGTQTLLLVAADVSNKAQFSCTGKEIFFALNSDPTTPYTVTVTSKTDERGRTGDIATYSIAAGGKSAFVWGPADMAGWRQSDGYCYVEANNAAIYYGVIRMH